MLPINQIIEPIKVNKLLEIVYYILIKIAIESCCLLQKRLRL